MSDDPFEPIIPKDLFALDLAEGFAWVGGAGWFEYTRAYRDAARSLVNLREQGEQICGDGAAFPIVSLYRHYLELAMKDFIQENASPVGLSTNYPTNHALPSLWRACREIIEAWWPRTTSEQIEAVAKQLQALHEVDPTATAFRYPVDKSGRPSLRDLDCVSLGHFADQVEAIGDLLDGWDTGIYEEANARAHRADLG